MSFKYNPYDVICMGEDCKAYKLCSDLCILKPKSKNYLKGCNYSKIGDCKYCKNKRKCILLKPYSDDLFNVEVKRGNLEKENKELQRLICEWDKIERHLDDYHVNSVFEVVNFQRSRQQMIDRINDNLKLIKAYLKKEDKLINDLLN